MTMLPSPTNIDHNSLTYPHCSLAAIIDDAELLKILELSSPIYDVLDCDIKPSDDPSPTIDNNNCKVVPDLIGADEEEYDDLESIYSSSTHRSYNHSQVQHKRRKMINDQEDEDPFANLEFVDVVFPAATSATITNNETTVSTTGCNDDMEWNPFQLNTRFVPDACDNDPLLSLNHAKFSEKYEEDIRLSMALSSIQ